MKKHLKSILIFILAVICITANALFVGCKTGNDGESGNKPHEHSYTSVVTAPTCTEVGYTTYTCTCGNGYNDDYVNATGHKPGTEEKENYKAPTATVNGSYDSVIRCTVCGQLISKTNIKLPATGGNSSTQTPSGNDKSQAWKNNAYLSMIPYPSFGTCTTIDTSYQNTSIGTYRGWVGAMFTGVTQSQASSYANTLKSSGFTVQQSTTNTAGAYSFSAYNSSRTYMVAIGYSNNTFSVTMYKC